MADDRRLFRPLGLWGNNITVQTFDNETSEVRVMGLTPTRPKVGDWLALSLESKRQGAWRFTEVELEDDPPDMWFGTAEIIGYLDEQDDAPEEKKLTVEDVFPLANRPLNG